MVGLFGVRGKLDPAERQDWDEFTRAQEARERLFTMTAGRLIRLLALEDELADEVERAVYARNILAHHLKMPVATCHRCEEGSFAGEVQAFALCAA